MSTSPFVIFPLMYVIGVLSYTMLGTRTAGDSEHRGRPPSDSGDDTAGSARHLRHTSTPSTPSTPGIPGLHHVRHPADPGSGEDTDPEQDTDPEEETPSVHPELRRVFQPWMEEHKNQKAVPKAAAEYQMLRTSFGNYQRLCNDLKDLKNNTGLVIGFEITDSNYIADHITKDADDQFEKLKNAKTIPTIQSIEEFHQLVQKAMEALNGAYQHVSIIILHLTRLGELSSRLPGETILKDTRDKVLSWTPILVNNVKDKHADIKAALHEVTSCDQKYIGPVHKYFDVAEKHDSLSKKCDSVEKHCATDSTCQKLVQEAKKQLQQFLTDNMAGLHALAGEWKMDELPNNMDNFQALIDKMGDEYGKALQEIDMKLDEAAGAKTSGLTDDEIKNIAEAFKNLFFV